MGVVKTVQPWHVPNPKEVYSKAQPGSFFPSHTHWDIRHSLRRSSTLEFEVHKKAKLTVQSYPVSHARAKPSRIVLTGFMGSGKSTVGPMVARLLGWHFVDVDDVIESDTGLIIAEIFARHGEIAFRDREHATIARLATGSGLVMALGGGAIERKETRDLLLATPETLLIHLEVGLETTLARCRGTENTRPVLADRANLERRYRQRLPLYRTAHVNLIVDTLTPEQVAAEILAAAGLNGRGEQP